MADWLDADGGEPGDVDEAASRAALRAELLALLLEPLGVDASVGIAALEQLADRIGAVTQTIGLPSRPTSGSTLRWVSDAVTTGIEDQQIRGFASDLGWSLTPDETCAIRDLMVLEGTQRHLPALAGVSAGALGVDLAAVALAERVLPDLLLCCRTANQRWPKEINRSIHQIDVEQAITDLRRRRGSRRAAGAREVVLKHSAPATRDLPNQQLAEHLELVQDFHAAKALYDEVMLSNPAWWRWLAPGVRFKFRADRRDALVWVIETRDTGAAEAKTLEMLSDEAARAVIERGLAADFVTASSRLASPSTASAARLMEGLQPVAARCGVDELRALESWYANEAELFDRAAMAMDALPAHPELARALTSLTADIPHPFGPTDTSRTEYRGVLSRLRTEVDSHLVRRTYSAHAVENEYLVGVISGVGALERELRDSVRVMPAVRGNLTVAVVGRTKSGKTTLRKALTRDADRSGIGSGAHRTTRQTSAFKLGAVTYLDTPGVAAKDEDFDTQHARAACEVADAVIWNYADTLRSEEAEELQRLLLSGKPLLVVVNVKDRVDRPDRLRLFVEQPGRAFASGAGHTARIAQVATGVGVEPPEVLLVHSGAAYESLSVGDRDLSDRAFQASRLPDLEQALQLLLAERAVPLRAVRLADRVRLPLAAFRDRAATALPEIEQELAEVERSAPDQRDNLLGAIQVAGQGARNRLSALRQLAKLRLSEAISSFGGRDNAQRWSEFFTGLGLEKVVSGFEADVVREMASRGRVVRARAGAVDGQVAEILQVGRRPEASVWDRVVVALEEAGSTLLSSVAMRGLFRKFGAGAAGGPGASTAVILGQVLEVVAAAAKAVSRDIDRAREAMQVWKGDTVDAVEAELDALFASVDARLDGLVEDMTARVGIQFDMESEDVVRARERLEQLYWLHERVRSAIDSIDLILARRLLTLAGGDPGLISRSNRTPGVELRVWTEAAQVDAAQAALNAPVVRVLTERITICSDSNSCIAATDAITPSEGNAND